MLCNFLIYGLLPTFKERALVCLKKEGRGGRGEGREGGREGRRVELIELT